MSTHFTPEVLSYARVERPESRWLVFSVRTLLAIGWAVCAIGTAAILFDVKSVLVSGPALGSVGLTTFVLAAIARRTSAAIIGLLHVLICVVFVVVVFAWNVGPGNARIPFLITATGYTVLIAWPSLNGVAALFKASSDS